MKTHEYFAESVAQQPLVVVVHAVARVRFQQAQRCDCAPKRASAHPVLPAAARGHLAPSVQPQLEAQLLVPPAAAAALRPPLPLPAAAAASGVRRLSCPATPPLGQSAGGLFASGPRVRGGLDGLRLEANQHADRGRGQSGVHLGQTRRPHGQAGRVAAPRDRNQNGHRHVRRRTRPRRPLRPPHVRLCGRLALRGNCLGGGFRQKD
jgi:hypothetical protein